MNLIICRHGQTEFNLEDRFQGVSDSPLTSTGIQEAKRINNFLIKNYKVKSFFIDSLPRVKYTYKFASLNIESTLEITSRIREICYGDWEGKKRSQIDPSLLTLRDKDKFNYIHPGSYNGIKGESYKQLFLRLVPYLIYLQKLDGDIVVIAHHGTLISAAKFFMKLTDHAAIDFKAKNNQVLVVNSIDGIVHASIKDI